MDNFSQKKDIIFSVIIISYNQHNYIKETIDSILNQTYQNFEIIVSDDCSSDDTIELVKNFNDPRIKIVKTPFNMGINANMNNGIKSASNDYIIFTGGDDKLKPGYLEKLNSLFKENENINVIYTNSTLIDATDRYIEGKDTPHFTLENISREERLNEMFMKTNRIPSPGMAIKKEELLKFWPLNNSLIVYQDFCTNIELLEDTEKDFMLLNDVFVERRVFDDSRNISNNAGGITKLRNLLETDFLMDSFLKIKNINFLKDIFKKEIKQTKIEPYQETIPFFLGQMALLSPDKNRQVWGYKTIAKFISNDEGYNLVHEKYNFTFKDFLSLSQKINGKDSSDFYSKYKHYKKFLNLSFILFGTVITFLIIIIFLILN